jgi:hypothetical protein
MMRAMNLNFKPEDVLAYLTVPTESSELARRLSQSVPSILFDGGHIEPENADYPSIGSVGQVLAAMFGLQSTGTFESTGYPATATGDRYTSTITSHTRAIGVVFEWSISNEQKRAFTMTVACRDFQGLEFFDGNTAALTLLDRTVEVAVNGDCPGGKIYLPFGYKAATMMAEGRIQIGVANAPQTGTTLLRGAGTATAYIDDVPTAATAFGLTARLICANSNALLKFARAAGAAVARRAA